MKASVIDTSASKGGSVNSKVCDYANTTIMVASSAAADGSSTLLAVVTLKNVDNSPCVGFKPSYEITPVEGVTKMDCTNSDINGVSSCLVKAITPGAKTFSLTNAKVGLAQPIEFTAPSGLQRLNTMAGGAIGTTANGSKMQVSIGSPVKGVRHTTAGGYKVILSTQGVVTQ